MIRRPPRSTRVRSSAASDVYKRQRRRRGRELRRRVAQQPRHRRPGALLPHERAPVSYTHLRAHETPEHLVCRLLLEKKKKNQTVKTKKKKKKKKKIKKKKKTTTK